MECIALNYYRFTIPVFAIGGSSYALFHMDVWLPISALILGGILIGWQQRADSPGQWNHLPGMDLSQLSSGQPLVHIPQDQLGVL